MNKLVIILFLLISSLAAGQSVTAPVAKSYTLNTASQDGSGFVLSGFNASATLLTSISLVTAPAGTSFILTNTTGLTAASGFTLAGNKNRLVVTGTMASINTALASLKINTSTTKGAIKISVAATVNPANVYYNGVNGHFYQPVTPGGTYIQAREASLLSTFKGQKGYLVTITSASENAFIFANVPQGNIWFAATDEVVEGRWVIDAGPEKGTVMKTQNGHLAGNIAGVYNNWAPGEPNGVNGSENYAVTNWNNQSTWNDLSNSWTNPYIIEYGTWTNPDDQTFTEFYTNSVSHTNGEVTSANFNFNFAPGIDRTTFSGRMAFSTTGGAPWTNISTTSQQLSGLGKVDMSADFDTTKANLGFVFQSYPTAALTTLTNQIVTVSDVYLAFKQLSNRGLTGGNGNEFSSGIQYLNADVDGNGIFNEADTYRLLQHLTGARNLANDCYSLACWMKLLSTAQYNAVTTTNWGSVLRGTRNIFGPITPLPRTYNYNYDINVFWIGDVNLSHSPSQSQIVVNSIKTLNRGIKENNTVNASIVSEIKNGKVIVTISLDPLQQEVVGTQFHLKYDNTAIQFEKVESNVKGTNFGKDMGLYVNLGSIITDGSTLLTNLTEYKITFIPLVGIESALGLVSTLTTDAVNKKGDQLKVNLN